MVLIDTDVAVDVLRGHPAAAAWLGVVADEIVLPGFVAMELIQGCRTKAQQQSVEARLQGFRRVWPPADVCEQAISSFSQFHLSHSLGLLDALIAQSAIFLNVPLHTFNLKHYGVVANLQIVQPYGR